MSLLGVRISILADVCSESEMNGCEWDDWAKRYTEFLCLVDDDGFSVDPMVDKIKDAGVVMQMFELQMAGTKHPVRWDGEERLVVYDLEQMMRCVYWWLNEVPRFAMADLRRHGMGSLVVSDMKRKKNNRGNEQGQTESGVKASEWRRDDVLCLLPKWNKFTLEMPRTKEEAYFN